MRIPVLFLLVFSTSFQLVLAQVPITGEIIVGNPNQSYDYAIDGNDSGYIAIVWRKIDSPDDDVYLCIYSDSGQAIVNNLNITDTVDLKAQTPDVSITNNGRIVVTYYVEDVIFGYEVYAQIFDLAGSALSNLINLTGNDTLDQSGAHVAVNKSTGNIAVAWLGRDIYWPSYRILAAIYDENLNPITPETQIRGSAGKDYFIKNIFLTEGDEFKLMYKEQSGIYVAHLDSDLNFIMTNDIAWSTLNASSAAYGADDKNYFATWIKDGSHWYARFTHDGDLQEMDFTNATGKGFSSLSAGNDGHSIMVWMETSTFSGKSNIRGQYFRNTGEKIENEFKINVDSTDNQVNPKVALFQEKFAVVWTDQFSNNLRLRIYSVPVRDELFQINVSVEPRYARAPQLALNNNDEYAIVWTEDNSTMFGKSNVFARTFSRGGIPISNKISINLDTTLDHTMPDIAIDDQANFAVAYKNLESDQDIIFQIFDKYGNPLINQKHISTTVFNYYVSQPDIEIDNNGNAYVAYRHAQGLDTEHYLIKYDASGNVIAGPSQVDNGNAAGWRPNISLTGTGEIALVYTDRVIDGDNDGILLKTISEDLITTSGQFLVNQYASWDQNKPSISANANEISVFWWSDEAQIADDTLYVRRFDLDGTPRTDEIGVAGVDGMFPGTMEMNQQGDIVFAWYRIQDNNLVMRRMNQNSEFESREFVVNNWTTAVQSNPTMAINDNGLVVIAWEDGHDNTIQLKEYYIETSDTTTTTIDTTDTIITQVVRNMEIMADNYVLTYPNPFNAALNIDSRQAGRIDIFDIQGRIVFTINISVGVNTLNLSHLSEGIYILKTEHSDKKYFSKIVKTKI